MRGRVPRVYIYYIHNIVCFYLFPTHVRWLSRRRRRHSRTDFWTAAAHRAGQIQFICFERVKNKRTRVCKPIYIYIYTYTRTCTHVAVRFANVRRRRRRYPSAIGFYFIFFEIKKKRYARNPRDRWKVILMETYFFSPTRQPFFYFLFHFFSFSLQFEPYTYIRFVPTLTYIHII